jgi:hypothetical protein
MLSFPDFNKPFDLHADASEYQLGAAISQANKPIAFYSRKLSSTQQKYTTGEREMLSIVEALKEFRNILLGHEIRVFTDHKNNIELTTKHASNRVQRWRWLIEEFGPTFYYLKGEENPVADALSCLESYSAEDFFTAEAMLKHEELCCAWPKQCRIWMPTSCCLWTMKRRLVQLATNNVCSWMTFRVLILQATLCAHKPLLRSNSKTRSSCTCSPVIRRTSRKRLLNVWN